MTGTANIYVGMTMVKKEQGQDDYFNQQSIHALLTLPAYVSPLILSQLFFNHCHSYIDVHFLEILFITCLPYFLSKVMLIFGYKLQLWQCIKASCHMAPLLSLRLLLG